MTDPRAKYEEALAAFAQPGNRWNGLAALTYWAAACGMDAEQVVDAAHAAGVANRDAEIRRGVSTAAAKVRANAAGHVRDPAREYDRIHAKASSAKPGPPLVRRYIEAGADVDTPERLRALSPVIIPRADDWQDVDARAACCEMQLCAMFAPGELVRVRRAKDDREPGRPGWNMKTIGGWLECDKHPAFSDEIVRVNPLSGEEGETAAGRRSFEALSCIASHRHAVCEFDDLRPLGLQVKFWAGFIKRSKLAPFLVALVYSGKKSIHAVLELGAADADEFKRRTDKLARLFASDPDPAYRLDVQAMSALSGVRLAGAVRRETQRMQTLLYLRDRFLTEPAWLHVERREGATESQQPEQDATPAAVREPRIPQPPAMPPDDAPLDDIMAAVDAYESWEAAGYACAWANRHAAV